MRRRLPTFAVVGAALVLGALPIVRRTAGAAGPGAASDATSADLADAGLAALPAAAAIEAESLAKVSPTPGTSGAHADDAAATPPPALAGLDLSRVAFDDDGASAPLPGRRVARLFVDPALQRTALSVMASHHLPEASVVLVDTQTGEVLVYASHVESGPARDLCVEATAPTASVFKIVTGSSLVENGLANPDTEQCYSGGEQRITAADLEDNPQRDRWCSTLSGAMGRSLNTVFARLALKHLKPKQLEETANAYGFGEHVPFDVDVQPSTLHLPDDRLGYARTAAGFWNTTLSPVMAAYMSTVIARGGEAIKLSIVKEAAAGEAPGEAAYAAPSSPVVVRRVVSQETARAVTTMMEHTVSEGTCFRAFHDTARRPFLGNVVVAGKTGTLASADQKNLYTWFTGFAPSRPMPGVRQVAIAVLVVNRPTWHLKANVVAREVLRAYFAEQKVEHVSSPGSGAVARR